MNPLIRTLILFVIIFVFTACKIWRAHSTNKKGIQELTAENLKESRNQFEKSMSYTFRKEIPEYNSGNINLREKDFTAAHQVYEKVISTDPEFSEALYNDAQALYYWGITELDEQNCTIDVTKKLWEFAQNRMLESKKSMLWNSELKLKSENNYVLITDQLKELENFPEKCKQNKKDSKDDKEDRSRSDTKKETEPEEKDKQEDKTPNPSTPSEKDKRQGKIGGNTKDITPPDTTGEEKKKRPKFDPDGKKELKSGNGKEFQALTSEEKDKLKSETERVKNQSKGKTHNRSKAQQDKNTKPGETEKVLKEALW